MTSVITNVILVAHIIIAIALTGAIMLQRSEGGALGIGGGGAGGGLMSARGAAGALVRTTMYLAAAFIATSLALTAIANRDHTAQSVIESEIGSTSPSLDENGVELPDLSGMVPGTAEPETDTAPEAGTVLPAVPSLDEPVTSEPSETPPSDQDTPPQR